MIIKKDLDFRTNYGDMYTNIQRELKEYITTNKLKSLVIGISGGIDSALCAVLAKPVCKELNIPLIGFSLPISGNKLSETTRAYNVGQKFCTKFKEVNLSYMYNAFEDKYNELLVSEYEEETARKIRLGNIKARMRMIYLYNMAQFYRGMVLSTDNYTEYLLGFWTLHGDVGDYGPFQNLWKTEVYGLSQWIADNIITDPVERLALQVCINATPTDGLGITDSDLDQLGCQSYIEVDEYLLRMLFPPFDGVSPSPEFEKIVKRHKASDFKRNNPCNILRSVIISAEEEDDLPF